MLECDQPMKGITEDNFCNRVHELLSKPTKRRKKEKGKGRRVHFSTKNKPRSELAHIRLMKTNENYLWIAIPLSLQTPPPPPTPWSQSFSHHKSHLCPVQKPIPLRNFLNFHLSVKPACNSNRCLSSRTEGTKWQPHKLFAAALQVAQLKCNLLNALQGTWQRETQHSLLVLLRELRGKEKARKLHKQNSVTLNKPVI